MVGTQMPKWICSADSEPQSELNRSTEQPICDKIDEDQLRRYAALMDEFSERMKRKSRWKLPPFQIRKALLVNFGRKRGSDRYRFELASVMAWLIQLPAARIASAISRAAKIVMAVWLVAVVCPCSCFACSRSWFSVGIEENLVTEEREVEPQRTLLCRVRFLPGSHDSRHDIF
jgi:hypothetical protein